MLEEVTLSVHDRLGNAQNRVEALLYVFDEPLGFLQLSGQLLKARVAVAVEDVRIEPVDAQLA
jgi:hypothetical protein